MLIGIIVGIPAYILFYHREVIQQLNSFNAVVNYLRMYRGQSYLMYIVAQILQILVSFLPGEMFQFAAGYLFGVIRGLILSVVGAALGTIVTYYAASFLGRDALSLFVNREKMEHYAELFNSEKAYLATFFIYLIPGMPKDICCYISGVSGMKAKWFLALSLAGRIPGMMISLIFGAMYLERNYVVMGIIAGIVLIIILICVVNRKKLNNFIDRIYEKMD